MPSPLGLHLARRGWTDGDLARATGLNRAHVNEVKNAHARPRVATALAIARALGVPVATLFPPAPAGRLRGSRRS